MGLKEFVGQDDKLTGVAVGDGSKVIEADIAIVGIGVIPNTAFLRDSGLNLTRRGEVIVDKVRGVKGFFPMAMRSCSSNLLIVFNTVYAFAVLGFGRLTLLSPPSLPSPSLLHFPLLFPVYEGRRGCVCRGRHCSLPSPSDR